MKKLCPTCSTWRGPQARAIRCLPAAVCPAACHQLPARGCLPSCTAASQLPHSCQHHVPACQAHRHASRRRHTPAHHQPRDTRAHAGLQQPVPTTPALRAACHCPALAPPGSPLRARAGSLSPWEPPPGAPRAPAPAPRPASWAPGRTSWCAAPPPPWRPRCWAPPRQRPAAPGPPPAPRRRWAAPARARGSEALSLPPRPPVIWAPPSPPSAQLLVADGQPLRAS